MHVHVMTTCPTLILLCVHDKNHIYYTYIYILIIVDIKFLQCFTYIYIDIFNSLCHYHDYLFLFTLVVGHLGFCQSVCCKNI